MPVPPVRLTRQAAVSIAFSCAILLPAANALAADLPQLEAGAQRGSVHNQMELGADYFLGRGVQRSEKLAAFWYERAARSGDPLAQQEIGYFYQVGIGVPPDLSRAAHWYQLAAAGGLASAKMNLGILYLWGLGVPQNQELALQLLHDALNKGCAVAAGYLGEVYYRGVGVPKDTAASEHWFAIGAKMRDPHSQFRLAHLLSSEGASEKDLRRAAALLRESGKAGFVPAKHALGLLVANHPELAIEPSEPVRMLEDAAAAGTWQSSAALGALARDGRLMPANPQAAYLHFKVAQIEGGDNARAVVATDLSHLAAKLAPDVTKNLDQQAAAWVEKHPVVLEFVYSNATPAFAMTAPNLQIHAGRLMPNPD